MWPTSLPSSSHLVALPRDGSPGRDKTVFTDIFLPEILGTATLLLLGCGVVANAVLPRTNGNGGGFLMINFGWGIAVFAGVFVAYKSGAHLNPAVTLGLVASGAELSAGEVAVYIGGQMVGAFVGAVLAWAAYKEHFTDAGADEKLAVFSTMPAIRKPAWNLVTEVVGTFVLVFVIISFGNTPSELGPLAVALLVVGIGASLGGPTGYAINPARDLGPRIAHAVLPIPGKGSSGWWYAWVPVAGPVVGGVLGGLVAGAVGYV
ncbi:aquaporin family protein [Nocardioides ganghwensis]|uniref:Aquaporin family protein n=1 Tax=Nocardioides ganghwensis TaxID=252230 RepID=A0A4Q2SEE7_9ACTN|nr:aquaporin family protein [Nocardioides ganghwensis]RYC01213.1 aquaporin family protein [Nocardioides ganghwensis]